MVVRLFYGTGGWVEALVEDFESLGIQILGFEGLHDLLIQWLVLGV